MIRHITSITVFLVALAAFASTATAKLRVVASLPDLGAVAKEVGGDRINVEVLAPHTVDPHYVDPRPNLILALNKADLLIVNGLELESAWLDPLVQQARNAKINPGAAGHFVASSHASLIEVPSGKIDRAGGDIHPGGNPHFYNDPTSMIGISNAIRDRLSKLDPEGAAVYAANAKRFTGELWKFAQAEALKFARLPAKSRQVVAYHKSLGYIVRWLQLTEVATVEPKPGVPPNPKHVAKVLSTMKSNDVRAIVQEAYYPQKTSHTLAKLAKGSVVVLPSATNVDGGESYIDHLNQISEALYAVLSK